MNTKRIFFWLGFIIIIGLIVWGLIVAMNKPTPGTSLGMPAPVTANDHVLGATSTAKVVLIEYSDFQCPACQTYYPLVEKLVMEASSTVQFVYRHFPLGQHRIAPLAARASEAAALQGKFWEMHKVIFDNQANWESQAEALAKLTFRSYAEDIGLDLAKYDADLDSDPVKAKVQSDLSDGNKIGVNSTPTFFVNGAVISNPSNYEAFKSIIEATASSSTQ